VKQRVLRQQAGAKVGMGSVLSTRSGSGHAGEAEEGTHDMADKGVMSWAGRQRHESCYTGESGCAYGVRSCSRQIQDHTQWGTLPAE
jgi:hypothetical protein